MGVFNVTLTRFVLSLGAELFLSATKCSVYVSLHNQKYSFHYALIGSTSQGIVSNMLSHVRMFCFETLHTHLQLGR